MDRILNKTPGVRTTGLNSEDVDTATGSIQADTIITVHIVRYPTDSGMTSGAIVPLDIWAVK